ncbi:MAG TPA: nickel-dependent hydrogenase large subunit [Rhodoblastus sp.]|nr:nickel-dependent hydrogenase large subunit [Rhodoblastus sp.]
MSQNAFDQWAPIASHRPWPRRVVDNEMWLQLAERLAAGEFTLLGLWGEPGAVHLALLGGSSAVAIASLACPDNAFFSIAAHHPPASRFERAIQDLHGLRAIGAPDARPWLDHGRSDTPAPYRFLPCEGEGLHQIPVGPVHAGVIEPGHFRFTASGETVVRLEERLGYVHKGIEKLMQGAPLARAAALAGRASGDSTVAFALAFARAVEAALGLEIPQRAIWLRALMAELERLANHLGDIGAICNDAAFALMLAHCSALREQVLRACAACFGHRLTMDAVLPGGVAVDLDDGKKPILRELVARVRAGFPRLVRLYDDSASLQDRTVGAGKLDPALARRFGAGGFVGRASGRAFDARRDLAYPPYDQLAFEVPVFSEGDVNARVWVRIKEVEQSLSLIEQILARLPTGEASAALGEGAGEGLALVEGFRGDILAWVRIANGAVERCHLRDPSWLQWPLLEAAIEGNIVADFPLCNKSFNCSYAGHDL